MKLKPKTVFRLEGGFFVYWISALVSITTNCQLGKDLTGFGNLLGLSMEFCADFAISKFPIFDISKPKIQFNSALNLHLFYLLLL